jgi:hypothetical protein
LNAAVRYDDDDDADDDDDFDDVDCDFCSQILIVEQDINGTIMKPL